VPINIFIKTLVMKSAENMLVKIPKIRVKAKPLTKLVPNENIIRATRIVVKLLSLIEGQARENPVSKARGKSSPFFRSSLNRSKTKTLASTDMPTDKIAPPIPAKVRVTGRSLKTDKRISP